MPELLDQSNKTSWVFLALRSISHFLHQSKMSCRLDLKLTWGQTFTPSFMTYFFSNFMEKLPCTYLLLNFGQFSRSYEVTKFWIWHKWCHTLKHTKHFTPGFLWIFLLIWWIEPSKFYGVFDHFSRTYEVTNFEWLNCVPMSVMSSTWMNIGNMLIMACMLTFGISSQYLFCLMMRKDKFKQKLLLGPQVLFKFTRQL